MEEPATVTGVKVGLATTSWIRSMRVTRKVPVPGNSCTGSIARSCAVAVGVLYDLRLEERIDARQLRASSVGYFDVEPVLAVQHARSEHL